MKFKILASNYVVISVLSIQLSSAAWAFRIEPMVLELTPQGPAKSQTIKVENSGKEKIAVEIVLFERNHQINGEETRTPTRHFTVFPAQLSLNANDSRLVRVTYVGPSQVPVEKSYRLIASQLPVDFKGDRPKNSLNFLFQYVASIYVRPHDVFAKIEIAEVTSSDSSKVRVLVKNSGSKHHLLKDVKVVFENSHGQKVGISEGSQKVWDNQNLLAGTSRQIELRTEAELKPGEKIRARIEIRP